MSEDQKDELNKEKSRLRRLGQDRRGRAFESHGGEARHFLLRHAQGILQLCQTMKEPVVAGYYPIRDEIDCTLLLDNLRDRAAIALPRMCGADQALDFHLWDHSRPLEKGDFGVMEPSQNADRASPDLVIIPLLAFDLRGGRLGYGGGYYDRTLSVLRRAGKLVAIGAGFDEQEFDAVPHGPLDQRLDYIITPTRFIEV